ncbi:MAG: galactose-1-epimerase, partial [Clostridiales Family XIII bacterium]|nr:galactose-1-epimerase [Clostridiales Family XIII bacterium]
MSITIKKWNRSPAALITITNHNGFELVLTNFGAAIQAINVPVDGHEKLDVVLGYNDYDDYRQGTSNHGAIVGRFANRIGNAQFELNGKTYTLDKNSRGKNTLHGGIRGYDKRLWEYKIIDENVVFSFISP